MGIYNLDKLFNPQSIAVIGASARKGSVGELVVRGLQANNFSGSIWPVNPKYKEICGLPCTQKIDALDPEIDMAVIATPIKSVPGILKACARQKISTALVVSDSRRETEPDRKRIHAEINRIAQDSSIRIIGPNSLGLVNTSAGLNITYSTTMPKAGKTAFVSQSGSFFSATLDLALKEQMGFSYFVSIGAKADVGLGDLVDYFGSDENVDSILCYIESLKDPRKFLSAARAVSPSKPIVVLKPRHRQTGVCSDNTDTAVFEKAVYDAAFKRAGIVSVDSVEELFGCAELMAKQPRPRGEHLVVINNGSAPGSKAADMMVQCHMRPLPLSTETIEKLDKLLPSYWNRCNPINLLSGAGVDNYVQAVSVCLQDKAVNGLLITMAPEAGTSSAEVARRLIDVVQEARIPILTSWYGGQEMTEGIEIFNTAGIPTFSTPEQAVKAFSHLIDYNRNQDTALEIPAKSNQRLSFHQKTARILLESQETVHKGFLNGNKAKALLEAYGFPFVHTRLVRNKKEAIATSEAIGYPVTMKFFSSDMSQQDNDAGNVEIDLRNPNEIATAFDRLKTDLHAQIPEAAISEIRLQPHIPRPDYKLHLGIKRDPKFGPVVLFGIGGIYSQLIDEFNTGLPPLNRLLARQLIENASIFRLLKGSTNRPPADMEQLEEMLIRLAQLAVDFSQIEQLDINPVIIKDSYATALEARVKLKPTQVLSPRHLVISPYPSDQEWTGTTKKGVPLFIRPVKPEDGLLLINFRQSLSDTSIYYRFFGYVKRFTPRQIYRFSTIDYDREIALIAFPGCDNEDKMLGIIRIVGHPDGKRGEFSIIISDALQGQGLGVILMNVALDIAKKQGYKTIYGFVLPENEGMKALAQKIGFQLKLNYEDAVLDLTLDLDVYNDS